MVERSAGFEDDLGEIPDVDASPEGECETKASREKSGKGRGRRAKSAKDSPGARACGGKSGIKPDANAPSNGVEKEKEKEMESKAAEEKTADRTNVPVPPNIVNPDKPAAKAHDGRSVTEKLSEIVRADIKPMELLAALEGSSSAVWVLWMHLVAIPPTRPELRALLCHIWDGIASDTQLGQMFGVHRHTIRKWKRELYGLIDELPLGTVTGLD